MKIVILGTAYPFRGGLASFNERMAQELLAMGHEVIIFTFTVQYPNFLFPGKTQFSESLPPEGLTIFRKVHSYNPINWWRVGRELKKMAPDLLITRFWIPFMGPSLGTILKRLKKNRKTRIVSIIDNIIPHESRPGDKVLSKYFTKQVERFVVMSKSVEIEMEDFTTNQPVVYSPHPIYDIYGEKLDRNKALQHLGLNPTYQYILFFGFIRDYKGLDLLLEAMAEPILASSNIRLIVAGEYYSNEAKYVQLIESLGVKNRVDLFTDFIPNEEVRYFFSAVDLVVQPYRSATQSGISQIAFHFDLPMVVTDVGGLKEIVLHEKTGYVVNQNPSDIAESITRFYTENKEPEFKKAILAEKEKYSWTYFCDNLLDSSGLTD